MTITKEKELARTLLISINIGLIKLALEDIEKRYGVKTILTLGEKGFIDHYISFSVCLKPYSVTMMYSTSCTRGEITYPVPIFGTYVKANTFDKSITSFCTNWKRAEYLFLDILQRDLESNDCFLEIRILFENRYCSIISETNEENVNRINENLKLVNPNHETVRASHVLSEYCAMLGKATSDCKKYYSVKLHTGHLYGVAKGESEGTE